MNKQVAYFLFVVLFAVCRSYGQTATPTINPQMSYTDEGRNTETEATSISESAPLAVSFSSGAVRHEENTEFTFTESGSHLVELWATFVNGNDTVSYTSDYWKSEATPLSVSIYESKLEFPNAFSPNGDGINDIFKAKDGYKSITEFNATVFNRWGQKIYSWDDPSGGWDGKSNGKDVSQGVYFLLVKARGADGRKFNIKKDINLLRGYTETQTR